MTKRPTDVQTISECSFNKPAVCGSQERAYGRKPCALGATAAGVVLQSRHQLNSLR
ncbi:MAG: hypothetical protein QY326_00040 [Bdellovibrionota bacterium]|nr:MAG: hypothetical protein QY326_00040 [Bdellovibrionota bacterium]